MATNKLLPLLLLVVAGSAWSREAALPSNCLAAGSQPPISDAKAALAAGATDLPARFKLADAWSDAGCFGDALQTLEAGRALAPRSNELEARIRVAQSVISEQTYFDKLDQAHQEAKLSRAVFRCTKLQELASCDDALAMKPGDPALSAAQQALRAAQAPPPNSSDSPPQSASARESGVRPSLRVARQAAKKYRRTAQAPAPRLKPVPIVEEQRNAVAANANADSHFSNDAPATRSN